MELISGSGGFRHPGVCFVIIEGSIIEIVAMLIFLVSLFSLMLANGLSAPQHSVYLGLAVLPLPWLFFLPAGCSIKLVTLRADMDRSA